MTGLLRGVPSPVKHIKQRLIISIEQATVTYAPPCTHINLFFCCTFWLNPTNHKPVIAQILSINYPWALCATIWKPSAFKAPQTTCLQMDPPVKLTPAIFYSERRDVPSPTIHYTTIILCSTRTAATESYPSIHLWNFKVSPRSSGSSYLGGAASSIFNISSNISHSLTESSSSSSPPLVVS